MGKAKITDLKPDASNYNKHTEFGMSLLEKSIRKFGFVEAGLISEDDVICSGNARRETAVNIGMEDVQIIDIDGTKPVYLRKKGLKSGSNEFKELGLALNAVGKANVVFDAELVEAELGEAVCEEWGVETSKKLEAEEDDFNGLPPKEPITVLGDLYELNEHRLHCADSCDSDAVAKLMNGKKADMVFTDPPYGMFLETDFSKIKISEKSIEFKGDKVGNKYDKIIGDNEDFTPDLITSLFANFDYCKEMFVFGADYFIDLLPNYGKDGCLLVWNKRSSDAQQKGIGNCFELFWSKQKHKKYVFSFEWFGFLSKDAPQEARNRVHPSMKPIKLICQIFEWFKIADYC